MKDKNENNNRIINETDKLIDNKSINIINDSIKFKNLNLFDLKFIKYINKYNKNKYFMKILNIIIIIFLLETLSIIYAYINNSKNQNLSYNLNMIKEEQINNIYFLSKYMNIFKNTDIIFNISIVNYYFSFKYNIAKVEYNIFFSDTNNNVIKLSDLIYYNDLHIICYLKKIDNNINIESLSNIFLNKYFNCIEYFKINDKVNLGIKIYNNILNPENITIDFCTNNIINFNNIKYQNDSIFDPLFINEEYSIINNKILYYNNTINNHYKLKSCYIQVPFYDTKSNMTIENDKWNFLNIYNNYFCFCKGYNCSYKNIDQICKYKFYLYIIDNNRYLYNKTDYLLADFLGTFQSSDDAYPIFIELIKQKKNAYYMTRKKDIYNYHCKNINNCKTIINTIFINGDFLEKYIELFLRLKAVIAGSEFYSIDNIFYNIEYITFICLTHGINYFKPFLYNDYYSYTKYNKLVSSTSNKIITLTKKYGWNDDDLIKICFPKWDKYDIFKEKFYSEYKYNKSIFIFFTWRNWKNITNKVNISSYYFNNIFELMNNDILKYEMKKNNITLYFSLHHMFERYRKKLNVNLHIKFIRQNQISDCLAKSNLIITDFSSIIFDAIYQKKPYIMYIPDYQDPNISFFYDNDYCNIINNLKNETIYFENKCFTINDIINKIKYYIYSDFKLEQKLEDFYNSFEFKCGNNTQKFINYLEQIK